MMCVKDGKAATTTMGRVIILLLVLTVSSAPLHAKHLKWQPSFLGVLKSLQADAARPNAVQTADSAPQVWPASYGPFHKGADTCDPQKCKLPKCRCSGTDIPGGLNVSSTPQMVLFSFQAAVNQQNFGIYGDMFKNRKNPNGCPRTGTFFVSHNYT